MGMSLTRDTWKSIRQCAKVNILFQERGVDGPITWFYVNFLANYSIKMMRLVSTWVPTRYPLVEMNDMFKVCTMNMTLVYR